MLNLRPTSPLKRVLLWGPFSASCCAFFFFFFQYVAGFFEASKPTYEPVPRFIDAKVLKAAEKTPLLMPQNTMGPLMYGVQMSHSSAGPELKKLYASASVLARDVQASTPVNVALAVDVSGSMRGEKLEQAKIASRLIIEGLNSQDHLSIVVYNTFGRVVLESMPMNADNKQLAYDTIYRLVADGGTNISEGLRLSAEAVMSQPVEQATRRVVFISDGLATEGLYDTSEIVALAASYNAHGVTVSTIGIGLDYNEDLMQEMARETTGNYYFVAETRDITRILELEFGRMKKTVATNVRLELIAPKGVRIHTVHGFKSKPTARGVMVEMGTMGAGQQHDILVELAIEGPMDAGLVMETDLSAMDARSTNSFSAWNQHAIGTNRTTEDPNVMARVQQVETATALAEATRLYEQGQTEDAVRVVDSQWRSNAIYVSNDGAEKSSFERVNKHLEELKRKMSNTNRLSSDGNYIKKYNKAYANDVVQSSIVF